MGQTEFFLILGHFLPFNSLSPPRPPLMITKIKILKKKKEKKCLEILSFYTYMCTMNKDHMIFGSWNIRCDRQIFFVISGHFLPFQPPDNLKNESFKTEKSTWIYYHFINVYDECVPWQSYDIWLLRYGVQLTEFFVTNRIFQVLDHFLPFYPPNNPKNQNFKKLKKNKKLEILSFYTCVP